jgi:hypothetical protein
VVAFSVNNSSEKFSSETRPNELSLDEWTSFLFKRIDLLIKRKQQSGITYWAVLTAIFVLFVRLASIFIEQKDVIDYISMIPLSITLICLFTFFDSIITSASKPQSSLVGLSVIKDVYKKGAAIILFLNIFLAIIEGCFIVYINFINQGYYRFSSFFLFLFVIYFILLLITSIILMLPFTLAVSNNPPTKATHFFNYFFSILLLSIPIYFGYFAINRLLLLNSFTWFYLEIPLLISCIWILITHCITYKFEKIPILELENLVDNIAIGNFTKISDIRKEYNTIIKSIDLESWMKENLSSAKKITSSLTRKIYELNEIKEGYPKECTLCERDERKELCALNRRHEKIKSLASEMTMSIDDALKHMRSMCIFPMFFATPSFLEQSPCFNTKYDIKEIIVVLKKNKKTLHNTLKLEKKEYREKLKKFKTTSNDNINKPAS